MSRIQPRKDLSLLLRVGFSIFLTLAVLAASLPQPAQAQTSATCRTTHLVREGNTKPYIAHTYGLKWKEIAEANDMNPADKLEVGEQLCIPPADESANETTPEGEEDAEFQASIAGNQITINLDNFDEDHNYLAKARSVNVGVGGWSKLGNINVEDDEDQSFTFTLPSVLRDTAVLNVCLKDRETDELICRRVTNPAGSS